jgi:hypothetical protein
MLQQVPNRLMNLAVLDEVVVVERKDDIDRRRRELIDEAGQQAGRRGELGRAQKVLGAAA